MSPNTEDSIKLRGRLEAMTDEPDVIRQIRQDPSLHSAWFRAQADESQADGCTFGRFSVNKQDENLALFEGWHVPPKEQGEIRWQPEDVT